MPFKRFFLFVIYNNTALFFDSESGKVSVFERNPFFFKGFERILSVSLSDAPQLRFGADGEEYLHVVNIRYFGVQSVSTLNYNWLLRVDSRLSAEIADAAFEYAVFKRLAAPNAADNLVNETLIMNVSAGLRKALSGSELGREKEVVHMNNLRSRALRERFCKGCFARCAAAVNRNNGVAFCGEQLFDFFDCSVRIFSPTVQKNGLQAFFFRMTHNPFC